MGGPHDVATLQDMKEIRLRVVYSVSATNVFNFIATTS